MRDLTKGSVSKQIFMFALPMVLGNVFQQLYSIVDSIVVGKFIGKEALAAVGSSFPVIYVLIAMVIGVGSGASVVISQYFGAKENDQVKRAVSTIFIFLFFAAIIVSVLGILLSKPLFRLINVPDNVFDDATVYFRIYVAGQLFFFGYNGVTSVLRGLGDSRTPLFFTILATGVNITLDLLFVVVFKMGVSGVALATIIAHGTAFISAAIYLNRKHELISFKIKEMVFDKLLFRQSLRIGLPTGFQQTFVALGMAALITIVSQFGTSVLAAYTVAGRIDAIASMPAMIFGSALSSFVGQNVGAGSMDRVNKGHVTTLIMAGGISVGVSLLVILFDDQLMQLFTNSPEVVTAGKEYLRIVCSFYVIFATMFTYHGLFRGAGDTLVPMFITLASLWIARIPLAWWLSSMWGSKGIWWAIPIAWFIGLVLSVVYHRMGTWRKKAVIQKHRPVIIPDIDMDHE
ncbi:MATE family efflux transporter [Saccharicrinis sp. FJH54]|uniref:MATE family efflux transporter n=1 Tax=Saccharicrinis sp. FJH54 TaxID=3344665 RepID=UPI0035D40915